jgi:hypothetical protein
MMDERDIVKKQLLSITILVICLMFIGSVAAGDVPGTIPASTTTALRSASSFTSTTSLSPVISDVGKISWSIDGLGVYPGTTGTIQVEKPAGATVKSAYMAAATTGSDPYNIKPGDIKIDGADVAFTTMVVSDMGGHNYWTDVTALVKPKIDAAAAGRVDFAITESPAESTDGELLVVIFNDPAQTTDNTIVLMFGAQKRAGDDFNIGLSEPLNLADPKLGLDFSLASSFSNQDNSAQYSIIDVNGKRLTSSAGGNDDGIGAMSDGNLFTVGGLDDSIANPPDAYHTPVGMDKRYDDELYTLLPFVKTGDTQIKVHTQNPSMDDNLLFAGLYIRSATAIVGEGILLSPASAENPIHTQHTVTAKVQDNNGVAVPQKAVTFTVISGPNAGVTGNGVTNNNGECSLTYTGNVVGTDVIVATFVDSTGKTITSHQVTKKWTDSVVPTPEFPTVLVPVGLIGLVGLFTVASRRW